MTAEKRAHAYALGFGPDRLACRLFEAERALEAWRNFLGGFGVRHTLREYMGPPWLIRW